MKIAFVGDTHFGYKRFYNDAFKQGEQALLLACEKADLIVLTGDIFDSKISQPNDLAKVFDIFRKMHNILKSKSKDVNYLVGIYGTHERRAKDMINPMHLLEKAGLIKLLHNSSAIFEKEKVQISGMSGVPDEFASQAIKRLSVKPIPGFFNVFVLHQSFKELLHVPDSNFLEFSDLPKGFDLYVNGHIHKKGIYMQGKLLLPGSTVVTQIRSNETDPKGFFIYDTQTKSAEFIPIKSRKFIIKKIVCNGDDLITLENKIKNELDIYKDTILKLKITGKLKKGLTNVDLRSISNKYSDNLLLENFLDDNLMNIVEKIRDSEHQKRIEAMDYGEQVLKEILEQNKFDLCNYKELLDNLIEGDEQAFKFIKDAISKKARS